MKTPPSILFLNRVYPPAEGATGQLLAELATALVQRGHRVTVVTAEPGTGRKPSEPVDGVRIERVRGLPFTRASHWRRALSYLSLYPALLWRALRLPRVDVVVTLTDPPLLLLLGVLLKIFKGSRHIHWAQDLYPELAEEMKVLPPGGLIARTLRGLSTGGLRHADRVIAVGRCMKARLVARGLVHVSGFTPSDAAHTLGLQSNWDAASGRLGAELFARRRDGRGQPVAASPEELSRRVLDALTRRSAEVILETAFEEDGFDGASTVLHDLVQRAVDGRHGIARLSVALDRPVIGLGASAPLHYANLPALVGAQCLVPVDTDVANALGAVVGQVRVTVEGRVSQPKEGLFRMAVGDLIRDFPAEEAAIAAAEAELRARVAERVREAGADAADIDIAHDVKAATVEGQRSFVEAILTATAAGRPRIAV